MEEGAREPPEESWSRPNPDDSSIVSDAVSAVDVGPAMTRPTIGPIDDGMAAARAATEFDRIFEDHFQRLVRALTVVAGDAEAAADAVQEAFVKAHLRWRRIGRYDDPVGWIRRVAINKLRDDHRRSGRKRRALARLAVRSEAETAPAEIDEFDRLLAELPRQQRAATALYYVDGLSIAEIASALDIADGSVKSHLHDARRRLRPVLEREAHHRDGDPKVDNDE
jgi:RNA polymerase sigma-70 factor (ECF subfamily)